MQPEQIGPFLERFASGQHTDAEHQQFIEWLKTASAAEVEAVWDRYNHAIENATADKVGPEIVSGIEAALDQYEIGKKQKPVKGRIISRRFFVRMAAASLIIGAAGIATWFAFQPAKHQPVVKTTRQPVNNAGAPGGDKAILTLSDGSTIILDEARNGQVAQQGGTQIAKLANGQLVYKASNTQTPVAVFNTLTTPRGGQFKLTLPDGSKVWLNAISSIRYPTAFTGHERKVEISGEAYFEIAHNTEKPFKVSVQGMEVKVLGTHFNINAYNDEQSVKTTLLEGRVAITKAGAAVTLQPGQQARVTNSQSIQVIDHADVDEAVAWKNGYFSFYKADLQTVMRQIARWYDVEISYEGQLSQRQFGGKIDRNSNVSEVLKILEESKVHFRMEDRKIIVKP